MKYSMKYSWEQRTINNQINQKINKTRRQPGAFADKKNSYNIKDTFRGNPQMMI